MMARQTTGLVAACDDGKLLSFALWPKQRELLAAVEAGPRLHVQALGRRCGKTTMAALVGLWDCLLRPELDGLVRPGERRYAVAVATNLRQARLFVSAALSIVERSPLLATLVASTSEDEIVFANGTALAAFPCSSRGGRGWPISTLLLDEAAHFLDDTSGPQAADRVWQALVPSTAQFGDKARILVCSTPYGTSGLFAKLYKQADDGELADARAHRATTADVNPQVDDAFLERERQRDPDSFRAEYEAEFLASGAQFIAWDAIQAAIDEGRRELPPAAVKRPVCALDPAFSADPFAMAIVDRDGDRQRLALVRSWRPQRGGRLGTAVLDEVASICDRYGVRTVVTDQASAELVEDYLRTKGLRCEKRPMTAQSKTDAYATLKAKLLDGTLELYPARRTDRRACPDRGPLHGRTIDHHHPAGRRKPRRHRAGARARGARGTLLPGD